MATLRHHLLAAFRDAFRGPPGMRKVTKLVPARHRCKNCLMPFSGLFSLPLRMVNFRASRKNPHLCTV